MIFYKRIFSYIFTLIILLGTLIFSTCALSEKKVAVEKFYSKDYKLICISHRGDTSNYPENSLEGLKSALEKGADFVSVNIEMTFDGVFYLCEDETLGNICNAPYAALDEITSSQTREYNLYDVFGNETEYKLCSLEELLEKTDSEDGIIIDVKSEYKDAVYDILKENDALYRVILRVKENGKKLSAWAESKDEKVYVIGKYTGNIIFSTVSDINSLTDSGAPAVQYESKNYFNVCFGEFFTNRYLIDANTRAVAATYSPDLCGQRNDGDDGWNELIGKGYSVIETNNIEAFLEYRNETVRLERSIDELLSQSGEIDRRKYSEVSLSNLDKAKNQCENLLNDFAFSLNEAQTAYSDLLYALKDMKISTCEVETRGALNVTAGKIIAAVLVGVALLSGQIYIYNMRKGNKKKI